MRFLRYSTYIPGGNIKIFRYTKVLVFYLELIFLSLFERERESERQKTLTTLRSESPVALMIRKSKLENRRLASMPEEKGEAKLTHSGHRMQLI
jgi:hypothetical protein